MAREQAMTPARDNAFRVRRWAVAFATSGPCVLLVAAAISRLMLGPTIGYSAIAQTMSVLASSPGSATVMTAGFAWCGLCLIITAAGLRVHRVSRAILVCAGVCGILVAGLPVSANLFPGMTALHLTVTGIGAGLLTLWPAITALRSAPHAPLPFRRTVGVAASLALFALLVWMLYEAVDGHMVGLAERVTIVAEITWPAIVALGAHFRNGRHGAGAPAWDNLQGTQVSGRRVTGAPRTAISGARSWWTTLADRLRIPLR